MKFAIKFILAIIMFPFVIAGFVSSIAVAPYFYGVQLGSQLLKKVGLWK